jgi:hypothetical protein
VLFDLQVDVTDHIEGHSSYLWATQQILDQLQLDTCFPVYNGVSCIQSGTEPEIWMKGGGQDLKG